ncbi:phosphocholine cytidylyltransferase family protein [Altererythrobacter lutimaris]|uniref:NTP transferase domain-containing protein n=1 Tax=Altererythrobacter lutimaris TaxID=2743979 RepID=A0A850HDU6_9SPHN|nr:NTP transferase domain-containing protein [Altererythrobacter lutimaris]NVE94948.1 NTP transferase domain-containing protein [Altererythrobacter lutimaris]
MDALILAAGFGSRLRDAEPCKPLSQINGVTLLEISARQLQSAGADRIVVATGYEAELLEVEIDRISARLRIPIVSKHVGDFTRPNGYSILAAADILDEQFLLVMADHIFSAPILQMLSAQAAPERGVALATDSYVQSELIDPDDATWVESDAQGRIVRIGKHLSSYNAVDCGAFRASAGLIEAIREAIKAGKPGSLSDGMQTLADRGMAWTRDIGTAWWIDVDDPHFLGLARQQAPHHLPFLKQQDAAVHSPEFTEERAML